MEGPYDDGYMSCHCFWGTEPARLVRKVSEFVSTGRVLDVGCGDGKNASFLASLGFQVNAFDVSSIAIANAQGSWPKTENIVWAIDNLLTFEYGEAVYDIVVATGPLHCLSTVDEVKMVLMSMQKATRIGGYNVISVFNDRMHDLSGHNESFSPILLPHKFYVNAYINWDLLETSDTDLEDIHPHTMKPHRHSITRLLARKP